MLHPKLVEVFRRFAVPGKPGECWLWTHGRDAGGYGRVMAYIGGGAASPQFVHAAAHRISFELHYGHPPVHKVTHTCEVPDRPDLRENRACWNPAHLEDKTQLQNILDSMARNRRRSTKGECNPHCKISDAGVAEIRSSTLSQAELARSYKVSPYAIWAIIHHKTRT